MSVGASAVRQDEFLIEITTPSKTDNVPKEGRKDGRQTGREVESEEGDERRWMSDDGCVCVCVCVCVRVFVMSLVRKNDREKEGELVGNQTDRTERD